MAGCSCVRLEMGMPLVGRVSLRSRFNPANALRASISTGVPGPSACKSRERKLKHSVRMMAIVLPTKTESPAALGSVSEADDPLSHTQRTNGRS